MITVDEKDMFDVEDNEICIDMDDCLFIKDTVYLKLTVVLKALGIKKFTYDDTTGEDTDFITHHGVDYISPRMVVKLSNNKKRKLTIKTDSDFIPPLLGRG